MRNILSYLFSIERKPRKGLLPLEWAMMGYLLLSLAFIFFTWNRLHAPEEMLCGRLGIVVMTAALWGFYRLLPCRFTECCRVVGQMALLSWWYPDTYEMNRMLPHLDHYFANLDWQLFACQPAQIFAERCPWPVLSELLCLGYVSYYPIIGAVSFYYFLRRYEEFQMAAFVTLASFFAFYVVFVAIPVAGPQFYYPFAGEENIAAGIFPPAALYFETHQEMVTLPGWSDGWFYQMVIDAHDAGERPTAAFPSSHVGVTVVLLWLAWHSRCRWLFWSIVPLAVLMFFATFYIQAHYVVDALAGLVVGTVFYFMFQMLYTAYAKPAPFRQQPY